MAEQGGFDCRFVEKPPEPFQSECPVCLLVLCEPHQASCCGYGFCQKCLEKVKLHNKPCPCCKAEEFNSFPDKRLKRSLSGYKVFCTNENEGCEWSGELGELENHLNLNSQQDKQLEGCQFVQVACLYCSEPHLRSNIKPHQNDNCSRRPFSCEYCKDFDSNYEDVTKNHWSQCGYYPVQCPLGCGESIQRRSYHSHVNDNCALKCVKCEFSQVGCNVKLPRRDMLVHLSNGLGHHMTLLLKNQSRLQQENKQLEAKCATLEAENRQQAIKYAQLSDKYKELALEQKNYKKSTTQSINKSLSTQAGFTETVTQELTKLKQVQAQIQSAQKKFGTPVHIVDFKMYSFDYYRKYNKQWISPPFFTHPYGYKICLGVDANGWGIGTRRVYVSVHIYLMKGEHDDDLRWPLVCDISVELLSQEGDGCGVTNVISFKEMSSNGMRVMTGVRAPSGPGVIEFISHNELQPKYLKNNFVVFRMTKVEFKL